MSLCKVYDALEDIASDRSKKSKAKKIQMYLDQNLEFFKETILYAYDYTKRYNITKIAYKKTEQYYHPHEIFLYLEYLATLNGATKEHKARLSELASIDLETSMVVARILKKDLRCGCSENTFKQFVPELPLFEIMTCQKDIDKFLKLANNKPYFISVKKNGVRTINKVLEAGVESHLSRSGLEYPNFSVFDTDLIRLAALIKEQTNLNYPFNIDGEAISLGYNFNKVMENARKQDGADLSSYKLCVFDIAHEGLTLSERYSILLNIFDTNKFNTLELLDHTLCHFSKEELQSGARHIWENSSLNTGDNNIDEGIVVKLADSFYEFKEHSAWWCKVKPVDTLDLEVVGFNYGTPGTKYEKVIGSLVCDFRGVNVNVSGLSDKQRIDFMEDLPKLIKVSYKEITPDGSLREPQFEEVRTDKTITSEE